MTILRLPQYEVVPAIAQYLEGTHIYDMDKHTRLIYHPVSGGFFRHRFVLAMDLLTAACGPQTERIVEVGYGAGLLFPTLSTLAREVVGVDIIDSRAANAVQGMLRKLAIRNVSLLQGSALELPFRDHSVDALLCLSMLEHLQSREELEKAAREMARVVRPGGAAILGFPVKNRITRILLRVVGIDDDIIHPSSHGDIMGAFRRQSFRLEALRRFPPLLPLDLGLYAVAAWRN